jgi:hypothetical protein
LLATAAVTNAASTAFWYLTYKSNMAGNPSRSNFLGGLFGWANELVAVGSVVAFSMWTHRVYRNLPALGARQLRYTPAWAVAWLFIPLANLVIPYFVFAEIWSNSIPPPADMPDGPSRRVSPLLIGWWIVNVLPAVVLAVGVAGLVMVACSLDVTRLTMGPAQVAHSNGDPLVAWFLLSLIVVPLLGSAAAVLAIFVVRRIDKNQQVKYELIRRAASGVGR